jgi:iron(III) transport system substrate-binding protein
MQKYSLLFCLSLFLVSCSSNSTQKSVTVYVSEDQVFSEPLLKDFEKETGIKVNAIYDTEESKSTGVMNRLIAEKNNPQADVYWANEPIRAEVLKQKGILASYQSPNAKGIPENFKEKNHFWTGFSARMRVMIAQKNLASKPRSILDYANPIFASKSVIANPLFGTTTAHIAALFTVWGERKTKTFLTQMKENHTAIATSNGESADFVASKSYAFALVDSDDAVSRLRAHKEVEIIYPDQGKDGLGVFVVPNAVMLIKHATHPKRAKQLIDYLLSKKSEEKLAFADCAQIPLHTGVPIPKELKSIDTLKVMSVDFEKVAQKMIEIQPYLKAWLQDQ